MENKIKKVCVCVCVCVCTRARVRMLSFFSHVWLCDAMNCSMPGFPVLHYLPEFAQTHVHWVGDAIQPPHPLLPPFPASCSFPRKRCQIKLPMYWSFSYRISPSSEYSGLISFRIDWLVLPAVQGTLKGLLQHRSSIASILWCSALKSNSRIHTCLLEGP